MPQYRPMGASDRGQAMIEAALVLPLVVFLVLGTLQLFLMLQGRQMAQYAAFWAAREGSVTQARCGDMNRVAFAALMPTFTRVDDAGAADLRIRRTGFDYDRRQERDFDGKVFWLQRESPRASDVTLRDEDRFDQGVGPRRLEVRLVFWYPMKLPFVNHVIAQLARAAFGLGAPTGVDPLMPARDARWRDEGFRFEREVRDELVQRLARGVLVFPIIVTSSMHMMTPPAPENFQAQHCLGPGAR